MKFIDLWADTKEAVQLTKTEHQKTFGIRHLLQEKANSIKETKNKVSIQMGMHGVQFFRMYTNAFSVVCYFPL